MIGFDPWMAQYKKTERMIRLLRTEFTIWKRILLSRPLSLLWWNYMPGEQIVVKWPRGWVVLHEADDRSRVSTESADPNDHYRPELEALIGRQGWDWNWGLGDRGAADNTLTIKICRSKAHYASYFALKWS